MSLKGLGIASAVVALVVVASACGEASPTSTPTPTPTSIPTPTATPTPTTTPIPSPTSASTQDTEAEYLAELKSIEEKTRELFDPIEAPSRETFLRALRESNPISELEAMLEQIEDITPPERFLADHERYIRFRREGLETARAVVLAAEKEDSIQIQLEFRRSDSLLCNARRDLSPEFIEIVFQDSDRESPCHDVDLTAGEQEYLDQVFVNSVNFGETFDFIGDALNQTWPTRERFLGVLKEADLPAAQNNFLQEVQKLVPPERFKQDQESLVLFLTEQTEYLTKFYYQTLDDNDLVPFVVGRANIGVAQQRLLLNVSGPFCRTLFPATPGPVQCHTGESASGGAYGAEIQDILKRHEAEFGPRVSGFLPALTPEELFASLAALQTEIEEVIANTRDELRALEPPEEVRADHERLVQYFVEILEVARDITEAAKDHDQAKLLGELFPESGVVLCDARRGFSEEYLPIVATFFGDEEPEFCV